MTPKHILNSLCPGNYVEVAKCHKLQLLASLPSFINFGALEHDIYKWVGLLHLEIVVRHS